MFFLYLDVRLLCGGLKNCAADYLIIWNVNIEIDLQR